MYVINYLKKLVICRYWHRSIYRPTRTDPGFTFIFNFKDLFNYKVANFTFAL